MNISKPTSTESNEVLGEISTAKTKIVNYLKARIAEIGNSVEGQTPDEKGDYPTDYYKTKDQRDILTEFLKITESKAAENFDSVEAFVKSICNEVQTFPEESYGQFIRFIERTFKIKVKPLEGPPVYYTAWLNHYAGKYGVTPEDVERVMPYELFQKFEQSNDTAARIRLMMENFGN